jgi:hypothetical protein
MSTTKSKPTNIRRYKSTSAVGGDQFTLETNDTDVHRLSWGSDGPVQLTAEEADDVLCTYMEYDNVLGLAQLYFRAADRQGLPRPLARRD